MALGGGFAAAMFGPVQRAGHQLDGGRIHDVDEPLETEGEARSWRWLAQAGCKVCKCSRTDQEELLGQFRIAGAIGVRECVFGWRRGSAQRRQRAGVKPQGVAHVVEPEAVGQLRVEKADDMAPRTERAGLIFHAGLTGQVRHPVRRNEAAKLAQERELAGGWLAGGFLFHALPCGRAQTRKPTFFYTSTLNPVGP